MWVKGQLLQSDKYKVVQQIGGGGFGLTYLAVDVVLHRQVVIKTPNQQFRADQDYEKFVRRFQREGQALSKTDHPNVVRVIEYFDQAGMPCLVMAYIEGNTLNERIRSKGRLSQDEAIRCFRKLAETLHYLHQQELIHCDIHPGNIILRPDGEPVLIDFGSAKLLQPGTFTVTTTVNESFAPYEQGNQENDPQAALDVYGLAATLYFALTGQKPQAAINRRLYGDKLVPPQRLREGIANWLNQAILEGMALEAKDRPVSMQAWIGLLQPPKAKFSWGRLGFLLVSYLLTGLILGLALLTNQNNSFETGAWAVAGAGAGAWVCAWAWAWDKAEGGVLAGAWAWTWAWAWAGTVTLAGTGAWAGAITGAMTGIVAGFIPAAMAKAETMAMIGVGAGALLGGGVTGYFVGVGFSGGLGIGSLVLMQVVSIVGGATAFDESLKERYSRTKIFFIFSGVPTLGLTLGGGLCWWLQ